MTAEDGDDGSDGLDFDCPVCGAIAGSCCSDETATEWSIKVHVERHELPYI